MSFDGRTHRSRALLGAYAHHPHAPALADALSGGLVAGYTYAQTHARHIGLQTYMLHRDAAGLMSSTTNRISSGSFVKIARFYRYIPAHANQAIFEVQSAIYSGDPITAHHRIVVTDASANTVTGDDFTTDLDAFRGHRGTQFVGLFGPGTGGIPLQLESEDDPITIVRGMVDLTDLTLPARCTVYVQAYAGTAAQYSPRLAQAWWET